MAHDLRSPTGAIIALAEMLAEEFPQRRPLLQSILSSAREILSIVEQTAVVLRASYAPSPTLEAILVGSVVSTATQKARMGFPDRVVRVTAPQEWPEICAEAEWFGRIWVILVSNAWQHGGVHVELGWRRREDDWEFWVRDDGPGLPPGRAKDPVPAYETLGGATEVRGLSLPLARRLAELMGGCLCYRRIEEKVTEFAFTVPVQRSREGILRQKEGQKEEPAVTESEARFREMANHMSQFAWMADRSGWIFWYNQRWLDYTGLPLAEMQGWGWQKVHHPDHVERVVAKIRNCFERGEPWEDTFPLRGCDGRFRWFLSRAVPIRDADGAVQQWFGTNTDITEQLAVEEQLRKASEAKDQFIAVLSHELRTPLNPALLIASEAVTRTDLPASIRADFETIRTSVEMEARLIDDLLDLTRLRHSKLALVLGAVQLDRVVAECIADIQAPAAAKSLKLSTDLCVSPAESQADELRLRQVFTNILRNAVKFTPDGGGIRVRTRLLDECFRLEVEDTGIGMSAEEQQRAFEPFAQGRHAAQNRSSHFGGLGLGLAIAQTFVHLHGGQIRIASSGPGQGTVVTVAIPLLPARPLRAPGSGAEFPRAPGGDPPPLRVLVVEDHAATRQTVAMVLERRGHGVRTAGSLAEAEAMGASETFDLVLSDLGLPDGRGDELLRRLRILQPELLAVALSGYGMETDIQASLEAGFSLHLTKPVSLEELSRALRRVHQLRTGSASSA